MQKKNLLILVLGLLALSLGVYWYIAAPKQGKVTLQAPRTVKVGQEFSVPLRINVPVAINAGEFYFNYPSDLLEVKEIQKTGSFYELWIRDFPYFNNKTGEIGLAGGLPKPGFQGRNGLVATITFIAKAQGEAQITLDHGKSRLLQNDGLGTELEATFKPVEININ